MDLNEEQRSERKTSEASFLFFLLPVFFRASKLNRSRRHIKWIDTSLGVVCRGLALVKERFEDFSVSSRLVPPSPSNLRRRTWRTRETERSRERGSPIFGKTRSSILSLHFICYLFIIDCIRRWLIIRYHLYICFEKKQIDLHSVKFSASIRRSITQNKKRDESMSMYRQRLVRRHRLSGETKKKKKKKKKKKRRIVLCISTPETNLWILSLSLSFSALRNLFLFWYVFACIVNNGMTFFSLLLLRKSSITNRLVNEQSFISSDVHSFFSVALLLLFREIFALFCERRRREPATLSSSLSFELR